MNSPPTVREQAERLLNLLRHAGRFWQTGLVVLVLGCGAALGVAVTVPRVYRSEALILYRERISASALGREEGGDPARRIGLRLRELVLSRSRLEKIVTELNLYPRLVDDRGMADAVDLMRTKVGFRSREGDTYSLSFEGEDPLQAQKVTQRLTDALVAETVRTQVEVAAGTKEFLDTEAERVETELQKREQRLAKFLQEHPAFATEAARATQSTGGMAGVAAADPRKVQVQRKRSSDPRIEAMEREAERIQARLSPTVPAAPVLSSEYKEAQEEWGRKKAEATRELETAQRDLSDKKQSLTDEHPDVKRSKGRVDSATRALSEIQLAAMRELSRLQGRPQAPIQPLTPEEKAKLQEELQRVQSDLAKYRAAAMKRGDKDAESVVPTASSAADNIVKLETSWVQLSRELSEAQEQRRQVEAKRFAADIRDRMAQTESGARMVVIDPPYKPTRPARGGRTQAAGLGGGIALFLAFLGMVARALVDERIYAASDIERLQVGPLLTAVPLPDRALSRQEQREIKALLRAKRRQPEGKGTG